MFHHSKSFIDFHFNFHALINPLTRRLLDMNIFEMDSVLSPKDASIHNSHDSGKAKKMCLSISVICTFWRLHAIHI